MPYQLAIGDRNFSSWSLRIGLIFDHFALPVRITRLWLDTPDFLETLAPFAPSRTVPALRTPEGDLVFDTLAIAETLAERHPELGLWPAEPAARARARSIVAEMHSGFSTLRTDCPMNLRRAYLGHAPTPALRRDLARIEELWSYAGHGAQGWLFGDYSIADACFAPVVARIVTYDLPIGDAARAYVALHLADPAFRRWRATGLIEQSMHVDCDLDLPERPWPGPAPHPARVLTGQKPMNTACPFSGKPVAGDSLAEIDGRIIGFCNSSCRDAVLCDPLAFPEVAALLATG